MVFSGCNRHIWRDVVLRGALGSLLPTSLTTQQTIPFSSTEIIHMQRSWMKQHIGLSSLEGGHDASFILNCKPSYKEGIIACSWERDKRINEGCSEETKYKNTHSAMLP